MHRVLFTGMLACALALAGCSDNMEQKKAAAKVTPQPDAGGTEDTGVTPDQAPPTPDSTPPATKKVGEACKVDNQCISTICAGKKCRKKCTAAKDCDAKEVCGSDDDKRLFCFVPKVDAEIGKTCAVSKTCSSSYKCLGTSATSGVYYPGAYCSTLCTSDVDCPLDFKCSGSTADKMYCLQRKFCAACLNDGNCRPGYKCIENGGKKFCSRSCTSGGTDCPGHADCKAAAGGNYCIHKYGACTGSGGLCDPCRSTKDCKATSQCLTYTFSKESFCATDCTTASCVGDYSCHSTLKKCVPKTNPSCTKYHQRMAIGDVIDDFAMVGYTDSDNNGSLSGEKLRLIKLSKHAAGAKVILFVISAGWCGPCITETKTFKSLLTKYKTKALAIFQVLYDGTTKQTAPTKTTLDYWVKQGDPLGAVGLDPVRAIMLYFPKSSTVSVPFNMLVDAKTMKVLARGFKANAVDSTIAKHLP